MPEIGPIETATPGGTATLAPARPEAELDDGDHERMAHIVLEGFRRKRGKFLPTGANLVESMVTGTPVRALCGKVWVPNHDPNRYPLCPTCREIAEARGWKLPGR
ncbi:MAG TPA: DUF3039 domain-containing protein [Acidimicrobiales bacterium]|nr:DUF3039 domain-containing protein [Acidimicrobiales bacterium]